MDLPTDLPMDSQVNLQADSSAGLAVVTPEAAETAGMLPTAAGTEPIADAIAVEPTREQPEVVSPAALADSVFVLPPVADAKCRARAGATPDFLAAVGTALPRGSFSPPAVLLPTAECLSSSTFVDALKAPWRARPVGAEFREFARRELVFEFRSTVLGPRMDMATEPSALPFTPVPPSAAINLWVSPSLEFPAIEDRSQAIAAIGSCFCQAERPTDSPLSHVLPSARAMKIPALTERNDRAMAGLTPAHLHDPGRVLSPFPVVLEGTTGGRAKPVQVFTAALRAVAVVDIPRYEALPLRPMMVVETLGVS
jgi:hypothetical protein